MVPRIARCAAVGALIVTAALLPACAKRDDGLHEGKVEVGLTTTTTDRPCDVPEAAERALTEASLNATRADKAAVTEQFGKLESTVPPSLVDDAKILRAAFEKAWATPPPTDDPFDTIDYLNADQAIRRYIATGCTEPAS